MTTLIHLMQKADFIVVTLHIRVRRIRREAARPRVW